MFWLKAGSGIKYEVWSTIWLSAWAGWDENELEEFDTPEELNWFDWKFAFE